MSTAASPDPRTRPTIHIAIAVGIAAAAMVATLPGRSIGLGLVTEPLLYDVRLGHLPFAAINFWGTLLGAAFCVPAGWLIDRFGVRLVLTTVLLGFGATVLGMARLTFGWTEMRIPVPDTAFGGGLQMYTVPVGLTVLVLLTRGLGQSALSVVSLTLVGKAGGDRPGRAIGVYSFLVAVGFMAAFARVQAQFGHGADWRSVWGEMGWALVGFAVVAAVVVRNPLPPAVRQAPAPADGMTFDDALHTAAFWVFASGTAFYGLVSSGMLLFNESLLAERKFDKQVFLNVTTITPLIGLAANLVAGWLAGFVRLGVLMAAGLIVQAIALAAFPHVSTLPHVYAYAAGMGIAGGVLTVVFFTVWRQAFGTANLGKIQGAAQALTVVASSMGPLIFAGSDETYGSYAPMLVKLAVISVGFAAAAVLVPLPAAGQPTAGGTP